MATFDALPAFTSDGKINVVVEAPRGCNVKLKYDDKLQAFTVSRALPIGLSYPFDWGFIPGTCAEDGDPVDAVALHDASTYPGVVLRCRPLALIRLNQRVPRGKRQLNNRLVLVPTWAERLDELRDVAALSKRMRDEVEHFFLSTTFFTAKDPRLLGWDDAKAALAFVREHQRPNATGEKPRRRGK